MSDDQIEQPSSGDFFKLEAGKQATILVLGTKRYLKPGYQGGEPRDKVLVKIAIKGKGSVEVFDCSEKAYRYLHPHYKPGAWITIMRQGTGKETAYFFTPTNEIATAEQLAKIKAAGAEIDLEKIAASSSYKGGTGPSQVQSARAPGPPPGRSGQGAATEGDALPF